jgi:Barrel-sandwich domain of CusB or HlyD membrane-fusion
MKKIPNVSRVLPNRDREGVGAFVIFSRLLRESVLPIAASLCVVAALALTGCGSKVEADGKLEAPPPATVEREADANLVKVDHPEQFPLATAGEHDGAPELNVTGSVNPDVSRNIPVISLASGRVIDIHARIGDTVTKDQLLMRVQSSDISQAFSDYRTPNSIARSCSMRRAPSRRRIWKWPRTPMPRQKSPSRMLSNGFAY